MPKNLLKTANYYLNALLKPYRLLTSPMRVMPEFIIIGAQKGGTTSLYSNLIKHPSVARASSKEVHFFDNKFQKGLNWYRAHFPTYLYKYYAKRILRKNIITGESSPYYIFHPTASQRIHSILPRVKLIILFRNPVDRAYSHYNHNVRRGRETLSFEEAIKSEEDRLQGEKEKIMNNENYNSFNHQHYSYLSRGIYIDQIKEWMNLFPREQILILRSEDYYGNHSKILNNVLKFLKLSQQNHKRLKKFNVGSYSKMNVSTRKHLIEFFKSHNQRLYEYLGINFSWDK